MGAFRIVSPMEPIDFDATKQRRHDQSTYKMFNHHFPIPSCNLLDITIEHGPLKMLTYLLWMVIFPRRYVSMCHHFSKISNGFPLNLPWMLGLSKVSASYGLSQSLAPVVPPEFHELMECDHPHITIIVQPHMNIVINHYLEIISNVSYCMIS